ncbi:MAG: hypothetical protein RL385_1153, partial [Pseudomonadota bacterium]
SPVPAPAPVPEPASAPAVSAPAVSAPAVSAPERKVDEGGCRLVSTDIPMGDALLPLLAGLALWSQRRRARQR